MSGVVILRAALLQIPGVTALIGQNVWVQTPQDIKCAPGSLDGAYILITRVTEPTWGKLDSPSKIYETRAQLQCLAGTEGGADQMGEALKGLEDIANTIIAGFYVDQMRKAETDYSDYSDGRQVYRRVCDYIVVWKNAGGSPSP